MEKEDLCHYAHAAGNSNIKLELHPGFHQIIYLLSHHIYKYVRDTNTANLRRSASYFSSFTHLPNCQQHAAPALPPRPRGQLRSIPVGHISFREAPKYNSNYRYCSPQSAAAPCEEE